MIRPHSQEEFAAFTSDCNPLHRDIGSARKSGYRSRVVHGVNVLLGLWEEISRVEKNKGYH